MPRFVPVREDIGLLFAPGTAREAAAPQQFTKEQTNYRYASDPDKSCGACKFFVAPNSCRLVTGLIRPIDTCDLFERSTRKPFTADDAIAAELDEAVSTTMAAPSVRATLAQSRTSQSISTSRRGGATMQDARAELKATITRIREKLDSLERQVARATRESNPLLDTPRRVRESAAGENPLLAAGESGRRPYMSHEQARNLFLD